jgi:hypothetical protein
MYNGRDIKKATKAAAVTPKKAHPYGKDVSQYGYRDDSPFRDSPSLNIFTDNGVIDMSNTGIPLMANGRFLPPYSGLHQFNDKIVNEVPIDNFMPTQYLTKKDQNTLPYLEKAQNGKIQKAKQLLGVAQTTFENYLGHPMDKAQKTAAQLTQKGEDEVDNLRHPLAGRYTAEAIAKKSGSPLLGFLGSTALGLGHEIMEPNRGEANSPMSWWETIREGSEDAFNNMVGAGVGISNLSPAKKTALLKYLSDKNMIPDGYGGKNTNMYFKRKGGWLDNYAGGGSPSADKARAMLEDGTAHGHPLTQRQVDFFKTLVKNDDEDADVEEYRRGGPIHGVKYLRSLNRDTTSRNLKTSLNFLMSRNYELYGKAGTRFYDPRAKFEGGGWLDNYK